jgi:DNA helicase-2/ATP-dependent DNA helicase PcrA
MTEAAPAHLTLLNPEQYRAVTTLDGPLLILAGAGSGKTRVLTRRIAHALHEGADPKQIFACTFTNKAAAEMKERVIELVGEIGSKVWVSTFHSSCCRILRQDIEVLGYTKRFAIYDDDDQLRMMKGLMADHDLDPKVTDPRGILRQIDHYKNLLRTPDELVAEQRAREGEPFIRLWRAYSEALLASDALDFNDLIGVTVQLFQQHPDVLERWQDRFQYLMVDEYQDTNRAQYDLLTLLAKKHRNLAVVGDDDQSIYGFRGADISIIRGFQDDYPEATIIRLEQNYRSLGNILALANHVIAIDENRIAKRLWTSAEAGPKVRLVAAETALEEGKRVAGAIQQLRRMGTGYDDIAIIYRTNATSRVFERALLERNIPHRIIGGPKFYARREVRDILSYLRLVVNPADDAAFLRVVNVPTRGIGAKTLSKLREEAANRGMPLLRTARGFKGTKRVQEGLSAFVGLIDELTDIARFTPVPELVHKAIDDSGYKAMLDDDRDANDKLTRDATNRLANLEELVRAAIEFEAPGSVTPLDELTAWLDRISLTAATDDLPEDGEVTLMTVHNSKGLEYPVVFVVQMVEGVFPHAKSEDRGIEEERRLAYVAFTRAQKRLVVTRSKRAASFDARTRETLVEPSRFLYGLPTEHCEGDLPDGTPAGVEHEDDVGSRKLAAFLARRAAAIPLPDDVELTLVDIESPEQLQRGVKVHHPQLGVGEVRRVGGDRVFVAFGRRSQWVTGHQMQIVVD